ncbi:TPA: hypothetical protein RMT71_003178 [Escherichia coli]|nr:hypothetical protein [Escherichia coli]
MAKTPEGWVKDRIKEILDERKLKYFMPMTMGYGKSGEPDFDVCLYGISVKVEAKEDALRHRRRERITRGPNKGQVVRQGAPTLLQQQVMWEIRASGGITLLVDRHNYKGLAAFIDEVRALIQSGTLNLPFTGWLRQIVACAIRNDVYYNHVPEVVCLSTQ